MLEGDYAKMYSHLLKKFRLLQTENNRLLENIGRVLDASGHGQVTEDEFKTLYYARLAEPTYSNVNSPSGPLYADAAVDVARSFGLIADPQKNFEWAENNSENPASQDESDLSIQSSPETGKTSEPIIPRWASIEAEMLRTPTDQ